MMEVAIFCGICWLVRTQASALLQREGVAVGPMEMVRVDLSDEQSIVLEIASDFTYYETETVAVPFAALSRIFPICLRLIVR